MTARRTEQVSTLSEFRSLPKAVDGPALVGPIHTPMMGGGSFAVGRARKRQGVPGRLHNPSQGFDVEEVVSAVGRWLLTGELSGRATRWFVGI